MIKNIEKSSTRGYVSSLMIIYLLITVSVLGVITDKIIKTDKALINLKEFNERFKYERAAVLYLKDYYLGLKDYHLALAEYQEKLEDYKRRKKEYEDNLKEDEEYDFEEFTLIKPEYIQLENLYYDEEIITFNTYSDRVEIYFKDLVLTVIVDNYHIVSYSI